MVYRIEYVITTKDGEKITRVIFADDSEEAMSIMEQCNEYGYDIVSFCYYIEEM